MNDFRGNLIKEYLSQFKSTNRNEEVVYSVDREGDLYEFIRVEVHEGSLPDNFKFKAVYFALEHLSLQDLTSLEVPTLETDTYYSDLNQWATRSLSHAYLNEALEQQADFGIVNLYFDLIGRAQQMELDEISSKVYQFVQDEIEKLQVQLDSEQDSENEWEA